MPAPSLESGDRRRSGPTAPASTRPCSTPPPRRAGRQNVASRALEKRLSLLQIERGRDPPLARRAGAALIAEVLAALQRIGRRPPPAVLVRPEDILEAVRASMLLGAVVRTCARRSRFSAPTSPSWFGLRDNIADERKGDRRGDWSSSPASGERLASLVEARREREASAAKDVEAQRRRRQRARRRRRRALRDFVERIEKEISVANKAADAARQALGARDARAARAHDRAGLPRSGPARPKIAFSEARGLAAAAGCGITIAWFRRQ